MQLLSKLVLLAVISVFFATPAIAVDPDEILTDPALEERARDISKGLRCVVCKNQSIDESDASLAKDLRLLVRERLKVGDTDEQVVDYVVERYGEFVLLKPQFSTRNSFLWFAPVFVFGIGLLLAIYFLRQQRKPLEVQAPLSEAEAEKLKELIKD